MIFGIPSYKRPECRTIDTLIGLGVPERDIVVSLQDELEIDKYKQIHKGIQFIVRKADCAAGNRNTLLDALGRPVILLDDDITSFAVKSPGQNFRAEKELKTILQEIQNALDVAVENKCGIIGCAPTTNDIIAKRRLGYTFDCVLQGSFLIFLEDIRFNDKWKMVEDYEISLRHIRRGGHTLRANRLCVNKPQNGTNSGGLHERYENNELPLWIRRLNGIYPEFKMNKERTGGHVRF